MSRKSVLMATLALTTLSGMSITPALAQGHMGTSQEQKACSRDASRFCRKDLGNDGAVQGVPAGQPGQAVEVLQQGVSEPRHVRPGTIPAHGA